MPALCYALGVSERELCQHVEKQFSDELDFTWPTVMKWLECSIISPQEFHEVIATDGCPVDSLFIWLASVVMQTHLNFVHESSIWTSRASDCPDMMDAAVLYSESGFLAALHSHSVQEKEELPDNFCDPLDTVHSFESVLIVPHNKVRDVNVRIAEFDVNVMGAL